MAMASGVPGPDEGKTPELPKEKKQPETEMEKFYSPSRAPGFKQMLEHWWPGEVTPKMVTAFEEGMMKMISNSIRESKRETKRIEEIVKRRLEEE